MPAALKYLLDVSVGAALMFVLLLVFIVDRVMKPGSAPAANTLEVKVFEEGRQAGSTRLKLAVTPTGRFKNFKTNEVELWDDMGKLLTALGDGYKYDEITVQEMVLNPKKLNQYDVLFLTCEGGGEKELREVLPAFVSRGGILYASDWRYEAIAAAFPDMVGQTTGAQGAVQDVEAEVVDPDLRDIVGKHVTLKFNLPQWKTAAFAGPRVKTLIKGKFRKFNPPGVTDARYAEAPLMVKFSFGKGTVIFTSFHNEKQNSKVETKLLQYLVFSLVTAGIDADVNSKLFEEGFTPQRSNLLSTPVDNPSIAKEYKHAQAGTLRFTLGFRNEGAKLKINLKSPDNKQFTYDAQYTVSLEVPNAAAGTWVYTVTAEQLPYPNFPFTVTVGEKK